MLGYSPYGAHWVIMLVEDCESYSAAFRRGPLGVTFKRYYLG